MKAVTAVGLGIVGFVIGCGETPNGGANKDASSAGAAQSVGAERKPCYPNETCNAGLDCLSGVCVRIPDVGPIVGSEGGACYPNGTCNAGLTCLLEMCARSADSGWVAPLDGPLSSDSAIDSNISDDAETDSGPDYAMRCNPTLGNACNDDQSYCNVDSRTCQVCPGGAKSYNCDGTGECEASTACPCSAKCSDDNEHNCVEDTRRPGVCVQCENASHCQINPRAWGPRCNTERKLCHCEGANDCVGRSTGSLCRTVGGTKICSCENSDDCKVAPYTVCGEANRCEKT